MARNIFPVFVNQSDIESNTNEIVISEDRSSILSLLSFQLATQLPVDAGAAAAPVTEDSQGLQGAMKGGYSGPRRSHILKQRILACTSSRTSKSRWKEVYE